jgi:hypothetical protein
MDTINPFTPAFEQRARRATGEEKKALEQLRFLAERAADGHGLERRYNSMSANGAQHSISVAGDPFGGTATVGIRFMEANAVAGGGDAAADLLTPEGHALLSHAMTVGTDFEPGEVLATSNESPQFDVRGLFTEQFHDVHEQADATGNLGARAALENLRNEIVVATTNGRGIEGDSFLKIMEDEGDHFGPRLGFHTTVTSDNQVEFQLSDSLDGPEGPGTVTSISSDGLLTDEGQAVLAAALEADGAPFDPQAVIDEVRQEEAAAAAELGNSNLFTDTFREQQHEAASLGDHGRAWQQALESLESKVSAAAAGEGAEAYFLPGTQFDDPEPVGFDESEQIVDGRRVLDSVFWQQDGMDGTFSSSEMLTEHGENLLSQALVAGKDAGFEPDREATGMEQALAPTASQLVEQGWGQDNPLAADAFDVGDPSASPSAPPPEFGAVDNSALIGREQSWDEMPSMSELIEQGWGRDSPAATDATERSAPLASIEVVFADYECPDNDITDISSSRTSSGTSQANETAHQNHQEDDNALEQ